VRDVAVEGEVVIRDREAMTVDMEESERQVLKTVERLWRKLGASPPEAVEPMRMEKRRPSRNRSRRRA